jgi:hypothetical protein
VAKPLTRRELHAEVDQQLDRFGYGEEIPIDFGRLTIDVQIEHGEVTTTIGERQLRRKRHAKPSTG